MCTWMVLVHLPINWVPRCIFSACARFGVYKSGTNPRLERVQWLWTPSYRSRVKEERLVVVLLLLILLQMKTVGKSCRLWSSLSESLRHFRQALDKAQKWSRALGFPYSQQHALTTKLLLVYSSSGPMTPLVLDALGHVWKKQLVFAFTIEILPSSATSHMLTICWFAESL